MLPRKTLAMVQTAKRKLEAKDFPMPRLTDDIAIMRVEACGLCGSDYEQYSGALQMPMPVIPGHEPLGIIEAIGDRAAARWKVDVGDRVAVETMLSCHCCSTCYGGHYHLCPERQIYSYILTSQEHGLWGAYAQYMVIAANAVVHKMDKSLPPELAVMFNPLGAGFRWAVEMPGTGVGDTVLIMGPGQRGLASVIAAREAGAASIIVTGLAADQHKLDLAKLYGATHIIDVENENLIERINEITDGRGVDIVVEVTSYSTQPITDAVEAVRRGGTIVLAGVKGFVPIPNFISDHVVLKEIQIKGAIGVTSSGYSSAIKLIESRRLPLEKMHTHNFDLEDAELGIKTLAREIPGEESIHSMLVPGLGR